LNGFEFETPDLISLMTINTYNDDDEPGGVVKVDIYEVDTKIELKVDTF